MIRALVIGAGAVGQIYGAHLSRAGVHVALYVKPRRAEKASRGFTIHELRLMRRPRTARFVPDEVLTEAAEIESSRWDLVFLCVPTPALDEIAPLLARVGDATVITLQPGIHARDTLTRVIRAPQLVTGAIAFVAYDAPLEGEALTPGTAVFSPPLAATLLSGEAPRVAALVALLRRGGCPARAHADAHRASAFATSVLMPQITALQAAGWSFRALARGEWLTLGARAAGEAVRVASAETGVEAPLTRLLARPALLRWLLRALVLFAPLVLPFDLERYLEAHFTKVNDQSRLLLDGYRRSAEAHRLDAAALGRLYESVHG